MIDETYYLTDNRFRQVNGFSNTKDIERTQENIIYIELLSKGFDVKISTVKDSEIDLFTKKDNTTHYYQVRI